jgi:cold shock CspA family protein
MVKRALESPCVYVRGFDFTTTDVQLQDHMSRAGTVQNVKRVCKGSAEVTYSSADEAAVAIDQLQKTTIDGNSRFIDVLQQNPNPAKRLNSGNDSWRGGDQGGLLQLLFGGGGWGTGRDWSNSGTFKVDKSHGELGEFKGTIKSFGFAKNYGFITCPQLAKYGDVFLHGDMKKDFKEGQTVKFTAVLNKEDKPVAINLKSGLK